MIALKFSCAMCGKESEEIQYSEIKREFVPLLDLVSQCLPDGWEVQENWPSVDVYCSKRCAS